ncbi:hypothetical protein F2Q70_00029514 [Brassica cretica]|uniref:Serine/threonine-protein phosphatase 2A 55 kDa regulatory subunit B n=1 Tax=Brassica cretica TaxID=69181 RepID=A0A8S9FBS8_BRACR|nr:hypothetical protein F2Q70_00029514 [Brassica cretica]
MDLDTHEHFRRVGRSDTYLGELVELNQSDTYISELDKLSKLSDTTLKLSELSGTKNFSLFLGESYPSKHSSKSLDFSGRPRRSRRVGIFCHVSPRYGDGVFHAICSGVRVVTSHESSLVARCRRVYSHAHDYHINSISNNSDGETFISADDLRINLWNLEITNQSFNIVDVKPEKMEDLSGYYISSSKGSIRLIDLRQSALCDSHSKLFEEPEAAGSKSFFTEIIVSVSDIKLAKEGRYLLSHDYMTLKLWDINMDSGPLYDLYENDSIFDKFECCISGDGLRAATGSYINLFRVFGVSPGSTETATLEASRNPMRRQVPVPSSPYLKSRTRNLNLSGKENEIGKHETRQENYDGNSICKKVP